jgi:hypothetical protein
VSIEIKCQWKQSCARLAIAASFGKVCDDQEKDVFSVSLSHLSLPDVTLPDAWCFGILIITEILVPYFLRRKLELGLEPNHNVMVHLDVWSVHRSKVFQT